MLKNFSKPTLVMRGEKTHTAYVLINEAISKFVPGLSKWFFQMSIMTARFVIRNNSAVRFSSSCRIAELDYGLPPFLDVLFPAGKRCWPGAPKPRSRPSLRRANRSFAVRQLTGAK